MNENQFIAAALTFPLYISIWYTSEEPYQILGIMIPVINDSGQSILEYLEESTELAIEIQTGIVVNLEISDGQLLTAAGQEQLYYFNVTPAYDITNLVNSPTFATQVSISSIVFIDVPNQYEFNASGYNVLLNNVQDPRLSDYQVLQETYVQAGVQDSLYSSTGWINGRYEGSKTSQTNYVGISPTITGNSFEGVYFPRTITDAQIIAQVQAGAVTYTEYLNPGDESLPTYTITSGSYKIPASTTNDPPTLVGTISSTQTEIPLITINGTAGSAPILKIGDIIQVTSSLELMKIQNIDTYNNNGNYPLDQPLYKLTVERGYNYTTPQPIVTAGSPTFLEPPVFLSTPSLIFRLQGNKTQGAQRGKVQVKLSSEILHIDRFGYTISGSNKAV